MSSITKRKQMLFTKFKQKKLSNENILLTRELIYIELAK
jgi:hypothetical protein